jgi:hypothetical protein
MIISPFASTALVTVQEAVQEASSVAIAIQTLFSLVIGPCRSCAPAEGHQTIMDRGGDAPSPESEFSREVGLSVSQWLRRKRSGEKAVELG